MSTVEHDEAIIVSFAGGKQYYFDAAATLEKQLDRFGVDHDIVRTEFPADWDWADICKSKIRFFRDMLIKHKRPIAWVDVDTKVLRRPDDLLKSTADFTCYLRAFRYLVTFDPEQLPRLFVPSYLVFGYNERTVDFLNFAVSLVESMDDVRATDDYFLQEALTRWEGHLSFQLLRPTTVVKTPRQDTEEQAHFLHGDSGNVRDSMDEVEQHRAGVLSQKRQKSVFWQAARHAVRDKNRKEADVFFKKVFEAGPQDARPFHQYTTFLLKTRQWDKLTEQVQAWKQDPHFGEVAERAEFRAALAQKHWEEADRLFAEAQQAQSANVDFMKSRRVRADLDRRAQERGIPSQDRVKLWWMETPYPGNFGDIITPYLIEGLTGVPPRFSTKPDRLLAVGSIIKFAKKGTSVWGAGSPRHEDDLAPDADYRAVRGPLTRDLVLRKGGQMPEVYGDPAWFLPKIYHPQMEKKHKLGMILHVAHRSAVKNVDPDVKDIDIRRVGPEEIEAFIRELLSCEAVISTSLHGVIVAHAYGIPVRWCTVSKSRKRISGDGMKFEDYFQSVGRTAPEPLDLSFLDRITPDLAAVCTDNPEKPIDLKALSDAAPFTVKLEL